MDNELIDANPTPQKFAKPNREPSHAPSLQFEQLPELWSWLKLQEFSDTMKAAMPANYSYGPSCSGYFEHEENTL